jgi:hypothetical protein
MPARAADRPHGGPRRAARGHRPDDRGPLAQTLGAYLERDGRSLNRVAQAALIDVAYLWRLREGARRAPSRDLLIRLGLALRLEPEELDELLVAADYAPITLRAS